MENWNAEKQQWEKVVEGEGTETAEHREGLAQSEMGKGERVEEIGSYDPKTQKYMPSYRTDKDGELDRDLSGIEED